MTKTMKQRKLPGMPAPSALEMRTDEFLDLRKTVEEAKEDLRNKGEDVHLAMKGEGREVVIKNRDGEVYRFELRRSDEKLVVGRQKRKKKDD